MRESIAAHFILPRLAQIALDLGVSALAFYAAYFLRFEGQIPGNYYAQFLSLLPLMLVLRFIWRFPGGLHQQLWRFVSLREAAEIAITLFLGSIAFWLVARYALNTHVPMGVLALDGGINLVGYLALRGIRRLYAERQPAHPVHPKERRQVLLVGAGQAGNLFAKEIQQRQQDLHVIGFVDDDAHKQRSRIQGIEVLGTIAEIPLLAGRHRVDEVILCVPSATQPELRRILGLCHEAKLKVKLLPSIQDLIDGKLELSKIREVEIEDLLGRDPVAFDHKTTSRYLAGRVVMVTGAGGSIGSELCRQIAQLAPQQLVLVGRDEFAIYSIELELKGAFPALNLVAVIADVREETRMSAVFAQHTPHVVFHAAAHKHVPLMEKNPAEAVLNNVLGTQVVARLADRYHAETFVLISTDKAVNPTNVMGASKRVAEMVVQDLAQSSPTRFMSVRFGNVLGSSGSVIPLFKAQIAKGGPVTITHPEIIRYFMTIPEAAQLVLQTGALGTGGEVFVLDMGAPVKIVDLAREMITLSGFEPHVDIKIAFTGLRPGEKLYEELLTAEEGTSATNHKKIFIARSEPIDREQLDRGLASLEAAATSGDDQAIRRGLQALVKTYHYQQAMLEQRIAQRTELHIEPVTERVE
jgi:FlaA1/EpsC-like NDP-sugar epimerase